MSDYKDITYQWTKLREGMEAKRLGNHISRELHREAIDDLVETTGMSEELASKTVGKIVFGKIRRLHFNY